MFFLAALFLYAVWFMIRKRSKLPWMVAPLVLLLSSCALSFSAVGQWLGTALTAIIGWPAGLFGVTAAAAVTVVLVLLVLGIVIDLVDKKANKVAVAGLFLVPLLALSAAGPVTQLVNELRSGVAEVGTTGVSRIIGG